VLPPDEGELFASFPFVLFGLVAEPPYELLEPVDEDLASLVPFVAFVPLVLLYGCSGSES
jgi:hypothetical protein